MKWWRAQSPVVVKDVETQQAKLRRLSGEVLARYEKELGREIADPERAALAYGQAFASSGARHQAEVVATLAAQMLKVSHAMVNVVTATGQETVAQYSRREDIDPHLSLSESFCKHIIGTGRELLINHADSHPLVCDTQLARNGVITSYLGVPIANRDGWIIGVLCAFDAEQRDWSMADVSMLTQLSVVLTRSLVDV